MRSAAVTKAAMRATPAETGVSHTGCEVLGGCRAGRFCRAAEGRADEPAYGRDRTSVFRESVRTFRLPAAPKRRCLPPPQPPEGFDRTKGLGDPLARKAGSLEGLILMPTYPIRATSRSWLNVV